MDFAQKLSTQFELRKPDFRLVDLILITSIAGIVLTALENFLDGAVMSQIIYSSLIMGVYPIIGLYMFAFISKMVTGFKVKFKMLDELSFVRDMDFKTPFIKFFMIFTLIDLVVVFMSDVTWYYWIFMLLMNAIHAVYLAIVLEYLDQKMMKGGH